MSHYPRLKYANERRDWVRAAEREIPKLEALAVQAQLNSARAYELTRIEPRFRQDLFYQLAKSEADDARMYLFRAIHYRGMMDANWEEM